MITQAADLSVWFPTTGEDLNAWAGEVNESEQPATHFLKSKEKRTKMANVSLEDWNHVLGTLNHLQQELNAAQQQIQVGQQTFANLQAQTQAQVPPAAITRKVELFANLGTYKGERAKFREWWVKMKIWEYSHSWITKCQEAGQWPSWDDLKDEVNAFFSPQSEREWAQAQMQKMTQGAQSIETFLNNFTAMKQAGKVSDDYAFSVLESMQLGGPGYGEGGHD
ncbi:hypothetical protein ID866_12357 [Astraeus odoratus]|nr:hypothetical protein ID866_12357 [Astraeus odoratus]